MPQFLKHVGQVNATGKRCVVVFRELPEEPNSCLVVETETLPDLYHDDLITAVESDSAQEDMDFYKFATRSVLHDGRNMLEAMHLSGWLKKLPTDQVTMLPTREIKIRLNDLNSQLSELNTTGRTTSGDVNGSNTVVQETKNPGVLEDSQIAAQMRNQAQYFKKEAERLLTEADQLDPPKNVNTEVSKPKRSYNKKK
jgi:hypothetical protein